MTRPDAAARCALALTLTLAAACEGGTSKAEADGGGDDQGGDDQGGDGGGGDETGGCGRSTAKHFALVRLELLIDPLDFAEEPWDWDGGGIEEFWDEWSWYYELLAEVTGNGAAYDVVDLLVPLADEAAPILASPYVSPDPLAVWTEVDRSGAQYALGEFAHEDDQNLLRYQDLELSFANRDEFIMIDVYDRDLAFDDYAGWDLLSLDVLQPIADCGPAVYVYSDDEMYAFDSRVRAIGLEVESW